MRYLFLSVFVWTMYQTTSAQNVGDALRYSRIQNYGTARMVGVGGAFSALGADFGSASLNPAGMAMFRSDEFMFTPGLYFSTTNTTMDVNSAEAFDDEAARLRFANIGVVFNTKKSDTNKWRTINVGLGYNQLANFSQNTYYEGRANGTILNNWFEAAEPFLAGGGDPESLYPLGEGLAFNSGAIYYQNGVPSYDFVGNSDAASDRTHAVNTRGSHGEMTLSLAGNYMDRVMIGGTLGIPTVNYRQEAFYTESDPGGGYEGNVLYFDNLSYSDYVRTNGIGINAKLGATVRIHQMLRIGGAFHSPTFLNLTDNFSAEMEYNYQDQTTSGSIEDYSGSDEAVADPFNYGLRTPWKGIFGGAVLLKKYGFISADIEYTDYSSAHFNLTKESNDADTRAFERDLNASVQRDLKPAVNYKLGAEVALDIFRLRAGYNLIGKPQKDAEGFNTGISLGAGIRKSSFYMDLAFRRSTTSGFVTPYAGTDAPRGITESSANDVLMTIGFKF